MNHHERQQLAGIGEALLKMAQQNDDCGQAIGNGGEFKLKGTGLAMQAEAPRESEVDRELGRLSRALDDCRMAADVLQSRTGPVTVPYPSEAGTNACAVETCGSQVGTMIQNLALQAQGHARHLRGLVDALAV